MTTPASDAIDEFYRFLWPDRASNADRFSALDDLLPTSDDDPTLAVPRRWGVGAGHVVLDIGCGKGKQACWFAREHGCRVVAVDPVARNLEIARQNAADEHLEALVDVRAGTMEAVPLADAAVDLVWCRDMFNHVGDFAGALREAARVLRPSGLMLNCSAVATERLEPREAEEVGRALALNLATLSRPAVEAAYAAAGLEIVESGSTCDIDSPFFEGLGGKESRDYLRLAALVRAPAQSARLFGAEVCERLRGFYLWNVYLMIGKIAYHVWVLKKPAASAPG
ncbi:methyltransferase, FkbM family [Nannocystis exedens]|uniref:Methyltransferase, FkbM family n=1 Tax=Nannocystis exedens TaxID=54 RepID=A0A1I2I6C3_9BACT|nr:methyltransferase domain-containing protein [Nannocystis exedens]PCC68482.1 Glycine/sarcosine/dimethylglycine N-methyltransferase [Nannocystis exedens]SFF36051.1 methyltransferase, FkbM family [Nannocystis exedens]